MSRNEQGLPVDTAITRVSAFLRDEKVQHSLEPEFERVQLAFVPREFTSIPRSLMEDEERLGSYYGFSGREVRKYVKQAYEIAQPHNVSKSINNCEQLVQLIRTAHATIAPRLADESVRFIHKLGRQREVEKTADVLCFSIGVLVADALQRNAFPLSYFVATTHLSRIAE